MRVVQRVAMLRARSVETSVIARRLHMRAERVRRLNREGLDLIALGLQRDGVSVF